MWVATISEDQIYEFVESIPGDVRIEAYSTYYDSEANQTLWHSLILSGQNPGTKPTTKLY